MLVKPGTFSKATEAYGLPHEAVVEAAHGNTILVNGQWVVDWPAGLGTNLLGYGTVVALGYSPSLPLELEFTVAARLAEIAQTHVPGLGKFPVGVRFCKTGSEATTMAIRLARAVTGRQKVITFTDHYHGWLDWAIGRTPPAAGVALDPDVVQVGWENDMELTIEAPGAAAIIFEQPVNSPRREWPARLRQIADEVGAILIADEVVTGWRYALGGVCQLYGYQPDLICYGKALGGGLPLAAVVGNWSVLNAFNGSQPVFCSSTFWGENSGLTGANHFLRVWSNGYVQRLWAVGRELLAVLRGAGLDVIGDPPRSVIRFTGEEERGYFIRAMFARGHLFNRPNLVTGVTTMNQVRQAGIAAEQTLAEVAKGEVIIGPEPLVLFKGR